MRELEDAVQRAVILGEGAGATLDQLAVPGTVVESSPTSADAPNTAAVNLSLDAYFLYYVPHNQEHMSETEVAKGLGISRNSLWEGRQRLGIPRSAKR